MEEPGEQCTVVFALIFTEPANECVCVCVWGRGVATPPLLTLAGSVQVMQRRQCIDLQVTPCSSIKRNILYPEQF
jgi:hypothetical protein